MKRLLIVALCSFAAGAALYEWFGCNAWVSFFGGLTLGVLSNIVTDFLFGPTPGITLLGAKRMLIVATPPHNKKSYSQAQKLLLKSEGYRPPAHMLGEYLNLSLTKRGK